MRPQDRLQQLVVTTLEEFVERHAPGFVLPRTFGGHLVGTDAVADLAFTLGWLHAGGVMTLAGTPVTDAIATVLGQVDGPETHSFFSYRVAETLRRFGSFGDNTLLATMTPAAVENLRVACDSTELLPLLAGLLPRNYLAVLARCEQARDALGLLDDTSVLDDLVDRTRSLIAANPHGFLDESHEGAGRFDIYAADIYLFCEPLADRLGDAWTAGAAKALELVEAVAMRDGSSVTWGRSTGALSIALTIELAALAVTVPLRPTTERWIALAANAIDHLDGWFHDGVVTAHRHRSTEDYRGPQRRLQMTFDLLGKLAEAAVRFEAAGVGELEPTDPFPDRDELVRLSDDAAVWAFRSRQVAFALPLVSGRSSDYLPSPRNPGLFETPVDSVLACFVPIVHTPGSAISQQGRFVPGEVPGSIDHGGAGLTVRHDRFVSTRPIDGSTPAREMPARRAARYSVDGPSLTVDEHLTFDEVPAALSLLVPSTAGRPLRVSAEGATRVHTTEVDGMKEWQSAWGTFDTVTEIEIAPATDVSFRWSVAPRSRVSLTSHEAGYVRTLYDPIADRVAERPWTDARHAGDVAHIHWPEWCFGYGTSVDDHARIARRLQREGTRIAWTQHNLTPHLDEPDVYDPIYQVWADATDLAIHHSDWGMGVVRARYRFRDDCRHVVIPHPHFGPAMTPAAHVDRDEAAERLGLTRRGDTPPTIRIGVIGAPRKEKDLGLIIDAVRNSGRDDIELAVWSLSFTDVSPDDPRIVASVYENADRETYDLRLAACDVIALPFSAHTMLATGTASDLVATATPGLVSDWPYLTEHLGGLGIEMGHGVDDWTRAIDRLDHERIERASAAATELQARYDPARIGTATAVAIEELGVRDV